jgi:tight adherence protein B
MSIILLFLLVLVLSFAVLAYLLRPTAMEKAVAQQLAEIEKRPGSTSDRATILKKDTARPTTLPEELLSKMPWAPALQTLISQAGRDWRASSVLLCSLGVAVVGGWLVFAFAANVLIGVVAALGAAAIPYLILIVLRAKRWHDFDSLLPEAVDLMARGLRAGHSISAVMEMVGKEIADPVGAEFQALHKEQSLGLPLRDAMMGLVERMPLDDMRFLATAVLLQKESGGNLAQILDKTALVMRERARLKGQLQIYTAQGRITGWILCAAPFFMFALISAINHEYEKPLFSTPVGLKMVYGALGLMVLGVLVIRKVIDVKV